MNNMTSIKMLGRVIKIRKVKGLLERNIAGHYISSEGIIEVDYRLKSEDFRKTLLHEIFHAFSDRSGSRQFLSYQSEEMLCELFASFIDDNFTIKQKKK